MKITKISGNNEEIHDGKNPNEHIGDNKEHLVLPSKLIEKFLDNAIEEAMREYGIDFTEEENQPETKKENLKDKADGFNTKYLIIKAQGTKSKRKPSEAFMKPMTIGTALVPIIGTKAIPRTEVVKKLWAYIKKNGLQDKKEKRNINADENLKKVFGGKKTVSTFEMTKLVSKHLS